MSILDWSIRVTLMDQSVIVRKARFMSLRNNNIAELNAAILSDPLKPEGQPLRNYAVSQTILLRRGLRLEIGAPCLPTIADRQMMRPHLHLRRERQRAEPRTGRCASLGDHTLPPQPSSATQANRTFPTLRAQKYPPRMTTTGSRTDIQRPTEYVDLDRIETAGRDVPLHARDTHAIGAGRYSDPDEGADLIRVEVDDTRHVSLVHY